MIEIGPNLQEALEVLAAAVAFAVIFVALFRSK